MVWRSTYYFSCTKLEIWEGFYFLSRWKSFRCIFVLRYLTAMWFPEDIEGIFIFEPCSTFFLGGNNFSVFAWLDFSLRSSCACPERMFGHSCFGKSIVHKVCVQKVYELSFIWGSWVFHPLLLISYRDVSSKRCTRCAFRRKVFCFLFWLGMNLFGFSSLDSLVFVATILVFPVFLHLHGNVDFGKFFDVISPCFSHFSLLIFYCIVNSTRFRPCFFCS